MSKVVRLDLVGKMLDGAEPAPEPGADQPGPNDGPPLEDRRGGGGGGRNEAGLPEGCPVEPLGLSGDVYAYLDALRQYRELKAKDHGRSQLLGLFGTRIGWLYDTWPRADKDGNTTGWRPERCGEALMQACARRGIWDAADRVRGTGAWRGEDGELIWHCGDTIVVIDRSGRRREMKPGLVAGGVYPAAGPLPRPDPADQETARAGVRAILADLSTWRWQRGDLDARLLLGWLAAAHLGGALKWRASCWLTGGAGTGKSSLHDYTRGLFGPALISAESASPASIWQTLGRRTLPCAFDELEPDQDNPRRVAGMIELARIAASGGQVRRGGNDHEPVLFVLRSSFMFSSILIPPMSRADRQRLAILALDPLPAGQAPPDLGAARLRQLGACLRARLAAGWQRFDDLVLQLRDGLIRRGHSARGADQFGVLLACADLVLEDEPPDSDSLDELLDAYALDNLVEVAGDAPDHERCLMHLLSSIIEPYRAGGRKVVGEWIEEACAGGGDPLDPRWEAAEAARKVLGQHGLRVMNEGGRPAWLAVANAHQALATIFERSHWAGRSGSDGGWPQELRRIEGHVVPPRPVRFSPKVVARAVLVPIERVGGGETHET